MVYLEYERFKVKYLEIQNNYNDILTEKENLFTKTQPNAIRYDKENVQGGTFENGFDDGEWLVDENRLETLSNSVQIIFPYSILTSICQNYEIILEIDFNSLN